MNPSSLPPDYQKRKVAVAVLVVFAAILTVFGYWYYQSSKQKLTREKYQLLAAIGELKSKQIQQWRMEMLAEVERAAKDDLTLAVIKNALAAPTNNPARRESFHGSLKGELTAQDNSSALIFDTSGNLLASTKSTATPVDGSVNTAIQNALAGNQSIFSNFYRDPAGIIHIDVATPVRDETGHHLGALVLSRDADASIFALIQSWPTPSKSAETLLVQREGNEVVFLNKLRHHGGDALYLRHPLTATQMPAVQAVLGKEGVFHGRDYRDIEVVSDMRSIPGSPWFIVAKVDAEEFLSDVRLQSSLIILMIGLCLLLAAGAVAFFYRQRQVGILKNLIRAENEKVDAQNTVQKITDSAQDAILMMNPKGEISYWNPAAERIFGYTKAEALGQNLHLLIVHKRHHAAHAAAFPHFLRTGQGAAIGKTLDLEALRKDGREITVQLSLSAIQIDEAWHSVGILRDTTERKRVENELKRSEARFRSYFDLPLHGRCVTSLEKGWVEINDRLCQILGYTREEILRKTWSEVTHPEDLAADTAQFERIVAGEIDQYKLEKRFIKKDGLIVWTEISVGCVRNPDRSVDHLVCVMEDISERKSMETTLREALVAAEAAAQAKTEFLAVMSHELRTPLNGVLGFADLLNSTTKLDMEQKEYAETIGRSGEHLLAIVNDILDFSSIEKGAMSINVAPISIAEFVGALEKSIKKSATDKGLEFRCVIDSSVPAQVSGDARRIKQILMNLLGNAFKFTSQGSVSLHVRLSDEQSSRSLLFSVQDTGMGISSETLQRLFEPFMQADSKYNRSFGGTGLGLAISKRLAEAMGGTIAVTSAEGKGSIFTFSLPFDDASIVQPSLSSEIELPSPILHSGECVLVVEDDPTSSKLAGTILNSLGYRVDFAFNGIDAVSIFQPGKYHAIVMDMAMPAMDGLDATKKIREKEASTGTRVRIIAISANVMEGDIERCVQAGMDDFLCKPFKMAELADKLTA